jgi:hypothetical protein
MLVLLTLLLLTACMFAGISTQALANGDPASHVLPSREVFVPLDPSLCSDAGRRIDALTEATRKAGYPIKVAVIPTAEDLGDLFQLFRRPQEYARILASELPPQLFKGRRATRRYRLLVLTPGRAGLYNGAPRESRALQRIMRSDTVPANGGKEALTRSAVGIVSELSRADGHRVALPKPKPPCPDIDIDTGSGSSGSGGSGSGTAILIAVVVVAMLALALFLGMRGRSGPRSQ